MCFLITSGFLVVLLVLPVRFVWKRSGALQINVCVLLVGVPGRSLCVSGCLREVSSFDFGVHVLCVVSTVPVADCGGAARPVLSVGLFSFSSLRRSCTPWYAFLRMYGSAGPAWSLPKTDPHRRRLSGLRRVGRVIHPLCLSLPSNPGFFMIPFPSRAGPPGSDLFFGVISMFCENLLFMPIFSFYRLILLILKPPKPPKYCA